MNRILIYLIKCYKPHFNKIFPPKSYAQMYMEKKYLSNSYKLFLFWSLKNSLIQRFFFLVFPATQFPYSGWTLNQCLGTVICLLSKFGFNKFWKRSKYDFFNVVPVDIVTNAVIVASWHQANKRYVKLRNIYKEQNSCGQKLWASYLCARKIKFHLPLS